ncbi:hypothetical protein ACM66B_002768 [Microbotryomycetes sp. NB124-2]
MSVAVMAANSATRDLEMSDLLDLDGYGDIHGHMNGASSSNDATAESSSTTSNAWAFDMPNDFNPTMSPPPQQPRYEDLLASSLERTHDDDIVMNGSSTFSTSYMMQPQPQQAMSIDPTALSGASSMTLSGNGAYVNNVSTYSQPSLPAGISPASLVSNQGASTSRVASATTTGPSDGPSSSKSTSKTSSSSSSSLTRREKPSSRMSPVVEIPVRKSSSTAGASSGNKTKSASTDTKGKRAESLPPSDVPSTDQWTRVLPTVREHLTRDRIKKKPTACATKLGQVLNMFRRNEDAGLSKWGDQSDVPPASRHEILTALKDFADSSFWDAWLGRAVNDGVGILYEWLLGATKSLTSSAKSKQEANGGVDPLKVTLVPLLQILDKLDLTMDHYRQHLKLGARMVKLSKASEFSQTPVKTLAQNLVTKAQKLQEADRALQASKVKASGASTSTTTEMSSTAVKRKAEVAQDVKKKLKTATSSAPASTSAPKAEPRPATTVPEPAPKLPSFRKPSKPAAAPSGNQPLVFNIMQSLGKSATSSSSSTSAAAAAAAAAAGKKESSPVPQASTSKAVVNATDPKTKDDVDMKPLIKSAAAKQKDKKRVRWTDDEGTGPLELIKYIEAKEGTVAMRGKNSAKAMMEAEEADAFSLDIGMEEEIQWHEPRAIAFPSGPEWEAFEMTCESEEARSRPTSLSLARDVDATSTMPDEPAGESDVDGTTTEPKTIPMSNELTEDPIIAQTIAFVRNKGALPLDNVANATDNVQSLLDQLNRPSNSNDVVPPFPTTTTITPLTAEALNQLRNFDPNLVKQIASGSHHHNFGVPYSTHQYDGYVPPSYNGSGPPTFERLPPATTTTQRGGKKRKGRVACRFFNSPEGCRRGDQCHFKHD